MIVISTREFRENQKSYLDKIDAGTEVLLQRGKTKTYRIIPVTDNDTVVKKEHILAPDKDYYSAISAEELLEKLIPRIEKLFDK